MSTLLTKEQVLEAIANAEARLKKDRDERNRQVAKAESRSRVKHIRMLLKRVRSMLEQEADLEAIAHLDAIVHRLKDHSE